MPQKSCRSQAVGVGRGERCCLNQSAFSNTQSFRRNIHRAQFFTVLGARIEFLLSMKYSQIGFSDEHREPVAIRFLHGFLEYFFPRHEPEVTHDAPPAALVWGPDLSTAELRVSAR